MTMGAKLLTPKEWEKEVDVRIIDSDGWRRDNKSFKDIITRSEFLERCLGSTVQPGKKFLTNLEKIESDKHHK